MAAVGTLYYDSGSVAGDSDIESVECPLCCQELDLTDRSIQYCECGCKFWGSHRSPVGLLSIVLTELPFPSLSLNAYNTPILTPMFLLHPTYPSNPLRPNVPVVLPSHPRRSSQRFNPSTMP